MMKKLGVILMMVLFAGMVFGQEGRQVRRVNIGDKFEVIQDSTLSANDSIVAVSFKVMDKTPRMAMVERNITLRDVNGALKQLRLEKRYQAYLVRNKRTFVADSLGQGENVVSETELLRADVDLARLKNEIEMWIQVKALFFIEK